MIAMFLNEKNEKNIIFKNYFCVHMPFLIHWIVTAPIGKKWSFNRLNFTILIKFIPYYAMSYIYFQFLMHL